MDNATSLAPTGTRACPRTTNTVACPCQVHWDVRCSRKRVRSNAQCSALSIAMTAVIMVLGRHPSLGRKLSPTSPIANPIRLTRTANPLPHAKGRIASGLGCRPAVEYTNRHGLLFCVDRTGGRT